VIRKRHILFSLLFVCAVIWWQLSCHAEAGTIYDSPYVSLSPDRKAWTTNAGDINYTWYDMGTTVTTGRTSSMKQPVTGQHYYTTERSGDIPVGSWKVVHRTGMCIHTSYPDMGSTWHGISFRRSPCMSYYYSGWNGYCADCGERISETLIYMSKEAAQTIDVLEAGTNMAYYYLCPWCGNLEQGRVIGEHECKAVSYNQYKVHYDANTFMLYTGYMTDSRHMYNNSAEYEGNSITVVSRLSKNKYVCPGYEFEGWNTMPDGSGTFYADEAEIYNLTEADCNLDSKAGTITLYAVWRMSESTLVIDPGEGMYNGSSEFTKITQNYLSEYDASEDYITPPSGFTVSFETGTQESINPIRGTMHFEGWRREEPFSGRMEGTVYRFTGGDGSKDIIRAEYMNDSIELPDVKRDGCSFGGWYFDEEMTMPAGGAGDSIVPTKDITLYACWVELKLSSEANYEDNSGKGAVDLSWEQPDDKEKTYKLYQKREGDTDWQTVATANDIGSGRHIEKTFAYSEKEQTFFVPYTGFYTVAAYGAQGGEYEAYPGGMGGAVSAKIWLYAGEKLTIATGGTDGYNGGGSGTMFAGGGGYTIVSSDKKGTLLVAGGGGGASVMGEGKPGGATDNLLTDEMTGESAETGGGGGSQGGRSGEQILHSHTDECYANAGYDAVGTYSTSNYWMNIGDDDEDYNVRVTQLGTTKGLIDVKGNSKLTVDVGIQNQGGISGTIYVYNQNNSLIGVYSANDSSIDREWHSIYHSSCKAGGTVAAWYESEDYDDTDGWTGEGSMEWLDGPYADGSYRPMKVDWKKTGNGAVITAVYTINTIYTKNDDGDYVWRHSWTRASYGSWVFLPQLVQESVAATNPSNVYSVIKSQYPTQNVHFFRGGGYWPWSYIRLYHEFNIPEGTTGIYIKVVGGSHPWAAAPMIYSASLSGEKKLVCGYTEGEVVSAYPGYGGSNYVNTGYAVSYTVNEGINCGDGYADIISTDIGFTEGLFMKGVYAPDCGNPEMIDEDTVIIEAADDKSITLKWDRPKDTGTTYYHYVESYTAESTERLCVSNVTSDTLISQIAGYYIVCDDRKATNVCESNGEFFEEETYMTVLGDGIRYVHIAAVDKAGNISETLHLEINPDKDVAWKLYTEKLTVKEADNIYHKADEEKVYYVKSDGLTPFELDYCAGISGIASDNYQINYAIFESEYMGENGTNSVICPTVYSDADYTIPDKMISLTSEGNTFLSNYPFTDAGRSNKCRKLSVRQKFILEKEADGNRIEIVPRAGADTLKGQIVYSDYDRDTKNSVTLIGDGTGPVVTGFDETDLKALIDRDAENIVLEVKAEDLLSGVKEFYIRIENIDNVCEETWHPDADNSIKICITRDEPIFSGDFCIYVYASDNVGNETIYNYSTTEFAMQTSVERILEPHEPLFKTGESGMLTVLVWGYPDKVEVIFPDEMTALSPTLNVIFDYTDIPQYRHDEEIQFMVPLYTPEGNSYEITVRAYKGDKMLEQHPRISVMGVSGTVLDDFRTRLR
jgi:hypothetical protein